MTYLGNPDQDRQRFARIVPSFPVATELLRESAALTGWLRAASVFGETEQQGGFLVPESLRRLMLMMTSENYPPLPKTWPHRRAWRKARRARVKFMAEGKPYRAIHPPRLWSERTKRRHYRRFADA